MGLGGAALESSTGLRGGLARVAALLPLPWFIHRRADETDAASSAGGTGGSVALHAQTAVTQLSASVGISADQAATAIHKAVAVVAAVAVVGGGGYVASKGESRLGLLPRPDQSTSSARDAGTPVRPPLLPAKPGAREPSGPPAPAPPAGSAHGDASALLPAGPSGVPAPIGTPGAPAAVTPKAQADSPSGADTSLEAESQTSAPAADPSLPAEGDAGASLATTPEVATQVDPPPVTDGPAADPGAGPVVPPDVVVPLPDPQPCDVLPGLPTSCPGLGLATDPVPPASS
jgi:hypothetical protein